MSARQLKDARALGRFRPEGPDHLVERYLSESQSEARKLVCAAARTLQFMDATKLRPSAGHSGGFPNGGSLPGCDHYSTWYDRNSKRYVLADEPYEGAALSREAERTAWAARHGFTIAKPSWPGMYNPGGRSQLYLVSDSQRGIPLEPLVSALDQLPEPIVERTWNGDSAPATPRFVSPGSLAQATKRSVVSDAGKPARLPQSNSVSYVQTFVGPQRRPKGKMPIEAHAQVGQLLKSVLAASYYRMGVHNRVDAIHSELDEWTQREYTDAELPNERFLGLYYNASGSTFSRSISAAEKSQHVASLESVKQILLAHYPDSAPLRALLKKVDGAIKSMQSWV